MTDHPAIAEIVAQQETTYDSSDPEQVNEARKKSGRRKRANLDFVKAILELSEGREWLYRLLLACDAFRQPWVHGNSEATAFRCGKLDVGYQLLADAKKADFEKFCLMLKECDEKKLTPLYPVDGLT